MEEPVSRSQLGSPRSTPTASPDPEDVARIRAIATDFEYIPPPQDGDRQQNEDEQMDFQLFAPTSTTKSKTAPEPVQKIRLRSETPPDRENAGFLIPNRNPAYYFASSSSGVGGVALTGHDVLSISKQPCPGNAYPWKVLHLPPSGLSKAVKVQEATTFCGLIGKVDENKCRPGKKARIALRIKAQAAKKKAEERAKDAEEKEAKEREKRSQRNREKKLKRREKERAKKAEARAANGEEPTNEQDEGDSSDAG